MLKLFGILLAIIAADSLAQTPHGGSMVYMGDLNLALSPNRIAGNEDQNSSENNSINDTKGASDLRPLDLAAYGKDRMNKNLAAYKNIMYPISGSRGTTTSTAGGSGGCGCG
jgi:hypothetical protein